MKNSIREHRRANPHRDRDRRPGDEWNHKRLDHRAFEFRRLPLIGRAEVNDSRFVAQGPQAAQDSYQGPTDGIQAEACRTEQSRHQHLAHQVERARSQCAGQPDAGTEREHARVSGLIASVQSVVHFERARLCAHAPLSGHLNRGGLRSVNPLSS